MNSEYEGGVDGNGSGNDFRNHSGKASGNGFENTLGNGFGNTNTWYFYSPVAVSQGKALFEKLWGKRKNLDNWQRINKTVVASAQETDIAQGTDSKLRTDSGQGTSSAQRTDSEQGTNSDQDSNLQPDASRDSLSHSLSYKLGPFVFPDGISGSSSLAAIAAAILPCTAFNIWIGLISAS